MNETMNITVTVLSAIAGSIIGLGFKGVFGAIMGFILVLLIIWIFNVWKNSIAE